MRMNIYKPCEFAKMLGMSVKTLQRWDNEGTLKAFRSPTNRRYYTQEQYDAYMGVASPDAKSRRTVIYARVSNRGQKDDLENQTDFLREFANARGIIVDEVITDIDSGLNYKRKQWNTLWQEVMEGGIDTIIIAHEDRFIRFGFDWFQKMAEHFGTKILVVNNEKLSPETELVQDLINIIHVFSCRVYGLREYGKRLQKDAEL